MKKLLFLLLAAPMFSAAQDPSVISYNRYMPKNDKVLEFEAGFKAHAEKYHSTEWKWRVYNIESGPDGSGYLVIEGPSTWDALDKRGTLGKEHTEDFLKNVLPFTTEKNSIGYLVFREELSTVKLTDYADKIAVQHIYPKIGKMAAVEASISRFKKIWEAAEQSIAVYEVSASGELGFKIVTRYKQGLKERERNFRKPIKERFNAIYGPGAYDKFNVSLATDLDHQWIELLSLNTELSSK